METWQGAVRELLDAVGWSDESTTYRAYPGGVSLAISAPIDALYAATELNEAAWREAERRLDGAASEPGAAAGLRDTIAAEANPRLLALQHAARDRGVGFLSDDDHASVGYGTGSRTWPVDDLPDPEDILWDQIHNVPVALVTGTNGKTTTIRLLAAMVAAGGRTPGVSSTDWIKVGSETLDRGDWSGPGGARAILRDRRVEVALLETARGGMLRRGLGVTDADAAAILNVAEDHLGEWGIEDLAALVETKFVVARAARHLVLNADDVDVVARAASVELPITWFGLTGAVAKQAAPRRADSTFLTVEDGALCAVEDGSRRIICEVDAIPIALGGAARHNIANALAAIGVAERLGIEHSAIAAGLREFHSDPAENPGRLNRFELGGVDALVDFAHNPHGLEALLEMAAALPAERRLVLIGQAGDRSDTAIRDLARIVWQARPDRIVIKEMRKYLRGREAGEIPRLIGAELLAEGAPSEALQHADSELDGVRRALEWAAPGDLLLVLTHESRDEVLQLFARLEETGWRPGRSLPSIV